MASPAQSAEGSPTAHAKQDAVLDTTVCSKCEGPVPWEKVDPHADEANGDICSECGHFYGTPPYEGKCDETLLLDYCFWSEWEDAMKRVAYAPEEADHIGHNNCTALHWAVHLGAPIDLIRALVLAYPKGVSLFSSYIGCPLWIVMMEGGFLLDRTLEIAEIMVAADNSVLRTVPCEGYMESPLGATCRLFSERLVNASKLPESESMQNVLAFSNDGIVAPGSVERAFRFQSLLVNADYYGAVSETHSRRLVHACAGCRDPYFKAEGLLSLALRFHPEQLLETNKKRQWPLHIAVSTVNRYKKEYDANFDAWGEDEELYEDLREDFMEAMNCNHCPDFASYWQYFCECNHDGSEFVGCDCGDGKWCGCLENYCMQQGQKCGCYDKFIEQGGVCKCDEKFPEYYRKMTDEHRHDKKTEILMILDACPDSARRRDNDGSLPLHLAVANGKKWDGGVEALVEAYPEALEMRDPVHCLYPFMLAARGCRFDEDTTFELLRANPSCMVSFMSGSSRTIQEESRGQKRKLSASM